VHSANTHSVMKSSQQLCEIAALNIFLLQAGKLKLGLWDLFVLLQLPKLCNSMTTRSRVLRHWCYQSRVEGSVVGRTDIGGRDGVEKEKKKNFFPS
jgi:hypothetical protein